MRLMPWIILLFIGGIWGGTFSLMKIAVSGAAQPIGIAFWQSVVSGGLLLLYTLWRHRSLRFLRYHFGLITALALLGGAIPGVLFYFAAIKVSAGVLAITVALVPILTYAMAVPLRREAFSAVRLSGVFFGTVAILLLVIPENSLPHPEVLLWVLLACLSSVCYAAENLLIDCWKTVSLGPIRTSCGMNVMSAVLLLPLALASDQFWLPELPFGRLEWVVIAIGLITAVAYTLFVYLINTAGPLFASQAGYVVTLSGVLWGIALFGESHSVWVWSAFATMLLGLALVTPRKQLTAEKG